MKTIDFSTPATPQFEITVHLRDAKGQPTKYTKSYGSDHADKVAAFWYKYSGGANRRRPKKGNKIPDAKQADQILKNMYKDKK